MLMIERLVGTLGADTDIHHTTGATSTIRAGKYVAVRQAGAEAGAYHLYHADGSGEPAGIAVASVYLTVRSDGVIMIT